jgi:hypothetical protein
MAAHDEVENRWLELLVDMQTELRDGLQGLAGKQLGGLHDAYLGYTAAHINRAVEGYVYLRRSGRVDASKLLVRTGIEAVIRLQAVRKKPELLFRVAFTEFNEERKWVRLTGGGDGSEALRAIDAQWDDFKRKYRAKYPEHTLTEEDLSLRRAAECAGIEGYYDSHYRLYYKYTHAAFGATMGDLNDFDREDTRTMTLCAFSALHAVASIGAPTIHRGVSRLPGSRSETRKLAFIRCI